MLRRTNNYLKAMFGDPQYQVLFVGYQAEGAPGANIQASEGVEGFAMIDLDGEMYEINSAHADQKGLVDFVTGIQQWPERVLLVHGEKGAKAALACHYEQGKALSVEIPA
ncbi:hypothetical protein AO392_03150 [Pseudomonas putida]|nr:hypothetical protein AO392_03150 [Pseudomonas putida]